ncbi:MAG TPA: glutamate 5-kinase [Devosiaceae bacterium]|nr:glutamate 5-kinase [Devosiaceae bacterium]
MTASRDPLADHGRIVVKIGSALLVDGATGKVRRDWVRSIAQDVSALRADGHQIVLVSSGAIALGRRILGLDRHALSLEQSQAAASVGQIALSRAWEECLGEFGIVTGQILITPNITEERRYYLNARTTVATLLGMGAVPIINENDSVATAEIRYGDNDRLSARVATMIEADCLVLLSDVDGLYTAPPGSTATAVHLAVVHEITPAIEAMAGGAASHLSRGGMQTKIEAAKIATKAGTAMIISRGTDEHPLRALSLGALHTLFTPEAIRAQARKLWIMGTLEAAGALHVDAGAARALRNGKSLLPVGVTRVTGDFARGDAVTIHDPEGREIARGLVGLSSEHAQLVKGKNSARVLEMLGFEARAELVHRDNMVVLQGSRSA